MFILNSSKTRCSSWSFQNAVIGWSVDEYPLYFCLLTPNVRFFFFFETATRPSNISSIKSFWSYIPGVSNVFSLPSTPIGKMPAWFLLSFLFCFCLFVWCMIVSDWPLLSPNLHFYCSQLHQLLKKLWLCREQSLVINSFSF